MAHSGCACHASLPRHRFHSILPPAPEIHNSQHKSRNARTVVQDQVASNPAVDLPASSRLSHAAHEYHHGCRHSVEKIQISESPEKFLTIIPAELDEACFQVLAPQLGESLTEKMRAILCSTGNAPLYCTPARNGGTVYWIAQTFSPINERAVRATGVSGISGDAVLVENAEYGPLQLARLSQGPAAKGKNQSPSTVPDSASKLTAEKQPAQGLGSKRSSHDEVLGPEAVNGGCVQSECSLKRGLTDGPEASAGSEAFHTAKCGPSHLGDPLVKRQRACSDGPSSGEFEDAPAPSLRLPEGQAAGAGSVNTSASVEPIHHSSSSVDRIESMAVEPVDKLPHQKLQFVDAPQQDRPPSQVGGHSHQPEDSTLVSEHASSSRVDTDLRGRGLLGGSERTVDCLSIGELQMVFSFMGFSDLSTASAVCKLWRTSIAEDEPLLKNLRIRRRMFQPAIVPPAPRRTKFLCGTHPLPFVLMRAAEVGNVPAMVLVAEEMERQGRRPKALEWWKKAARKGDQGSQYRVGEAYYRGDSEWPQDGEEALIWLNRAAKYVNGDKGLSGAAGLLLGYMHLDGEGIAAPDNTEAVRWFRFAAELGNREAEKTVGWLWNTGQF